MMDYFIELFADIPNELLTYYWNKPLNCLLTIAICSCYNKNNIYGLSPLYNNKISKKPRIQSIFSSGRRCTSTNIFVRPWDT